MLHKNFSRRGLLQTMALTAAAVLPAVALAQTAVPGQPQCPPAKVKIIVSEISNNHGHAFTVSLSDLVKSANTGFSIQGTSGHPHVISVDNNAIVALMQGQVVTLNSTLVAGHAHQVVLKLIEQ